MATDRSNSLDRRTNLRLDPVQLVLFFLAESNVALMSGYDRYGLTDRSSSVCAKRGFCARSASLVWVPASITTGSDLGAQLLEARWLHKTFSRKSLSQSEQHKLS